MATARKKPRSSYSSWGDWADLPDNLLHSIVSHLVSFPDLLSFASVCRSWRGLSLSTPTSILRPPLLLSSRRRIYPRRRDDTPSRCPILDPAFPSATYFSSASARTLSRLPFIGYSYGHAIFYLPSIRCILLADAITGDEVRTPHFPGHSIPRTYYALLTAPLSSPSSDLILLSFGLELFQWRKGGERWIRHDLGFNLPEVNHAVVFKGRIFTLDSSERLFIIQLAPVVLVRQMEVKWIGEQVSPFSFKQWLVECGGELLLVRIVPTEAIMCMSVEVFRLDLSDEQMKWVKVENLGDWALFLVANKRCPGFACKNPGRWGGRGNCIYYARSGDDTWNVVELGSSEIDTTVPDSPTLNSDPLKWPSPVWIYPAMFS
ncbi:putative F-box protein At2g16290 [Typha latifolia]|uniref:putative F-box protein At2g16290 n=1 Tax=Typha latifolia TaxID=4733 RepID=UPI003C2E9CEB